MYSAAVYNYFNKGRQAYKPKCRKRKIPIPKPSKKRQLKKCKLCGRKFLRMLNKAETDADNKKQPGNIVFEKIFLIWKYAKNLLFNTTHGNDPQKCSFKIITHKSYKKRSLHKKIVSKTSSLSQICNICEKSKIQMNTCNELKTEKHKINEHVINELKCNKNRNSKKKIRKHRKQRLIQDKQHGKKILPKDLPISNEINKSNTEIQWDECLQGKKQHIKVRPKSSRSSFKIKKEKRNCVSNITNTTNKKVATKTVIAKKKQKPRNTFLPKKRGNINKKKRMFLKENRKKVNRFASWQYMQHALSSVSEETVTNYDNENRTPVYLTFEEYCLILEAIDTQGSTAEKFRNITEELDINIEDVAESIHTKTKQMHVYTEDVATNTDQLFENTEDASTNTEQLIDSTEEVATNTEPVSETIEELNVITEETNEITEDINTEQLSETAETLAAINDPLSEFSEEFDVNIDQPSDIIIYIEEPSKDIQNVGINNELLSNSSKILYQHSSKEYEEDDIDTGFVTEKNMQTEESNEETVSSEGSLNNQQDETVENTYSETQAEENEFFEN